MKKQLLVTAFALALAATVDSSFAATSKPGAPKTPPVTETQTAPATGAQKAGRFVTNAFKALGAGLKWTGEAAGKVANSAGEGVTHLIERLKAKK
jgi:hypothetical protein